MTARTYPLGSPEREAVLRANHTSVYPFNGPTRAEQSPDEFSGLQDEWCAKAGYRRERDEYSVSPQDYGNGLAPPLTFSDAGFSEEPSYEYDIEDVFDTNEFLDSVAEVAGLTPRERQVVEWIANGNPVTDAYYAERLASALGVKSATARKTKERALSKLREHWANDMEAAGLVDPRYLEPIQPDEFECGECHLLRHKHQLQHSGVCSECDPVGAE